MDAWAGSSGGNGSDGSSGARLDLPTDFSREGGTAREAACVACMIDAPLEHRIAALAERCGVRFDTVLLAAWVVLLSRLSRQDGIVIDVAVRHGRTGGVRPAIVPAVALRLDLGGLATSGLLATVASALPAALPPVAGGSPRQIAFHASDDDHAPDSAVTDGYELALRLSGTPGRWRLALGYDSGLYTARSIERFLGYLRRLLRSMAEDETCALAALPMLDARQRREALEAHNPAASGHPVDGCVHALFEAQVRRTPSAIAAVDARRQLGYAALNAEANRLAHHLRAHGVGTDDRVAIYMDRGVDLLVALMAVLKAGAAYVPLDPRYPLERLGYMLADSRPAAVLTEGRMLSAWEAGLAQHVPTVPLFDLTAATPPWTGMPDTDPDPRAVGLEAGHLAYVLYTSGSTGRPKAVAMPHAPLVNLVHWQVRQPGSDLPRRTLQFAALGFDVAFQEIFATLCTGGCLCMVDQDTRVSAHRLFDFIRTQRIERAFLPYFALQMLAEGVEAALDGMPEDAALDCALREVITAGEQLRIEPKIRRLFERLRGCRLHNHYGPTETHVVTAHTLPEDTAEWPLLPSIGRPIANARVYVLDDLLEPVPPGVVGELHLAGPVVARGYVGHDDLTAERFLPDPFVATPGARMYRSGDLGRWCVDGTLEYLGRRDLQVKVRGFRVEPGEIEVQAMACPGVREAGVVVREDTPGFKRIVAYYTPVDPLRPVAAETLRRHLAGVLPEYMVPVAYVPLDALPLTPNGKLDRAALPPPGRGRPPCAGPYEAPRGRTEGALCRAMAQVLDLEEVGRNDDFFQLGGGSLLATRMVERLHREAGLELAVTALFAHPSPAALARTLDGSAGAGAVDARRMATPRRSAGLHGPIAIVAMAGRFPGAADIETFWDNLCAGRDSITRFAPEELDRSVAAGLRSDPDYVPARGVIDGVELFDAGFFGIAPREAELMDPQQRIFLELCWECLERGGHAPGTVGVPVGVFAGAYNASYYRNNVLANPDLVERIGAFQAMLANEKDYIATRVANRLDLTGPAMSVQTGCSTSLVAVCAAVDSLRLGRCDMALAGGVSITSPVRSGHLYQEGAMLSPDGHTRSFDADARGTVFSDGAAVLLLKRLEDAQADGDPIYAVIRGAGLNNDGGDKASFTAPSSAGQAAVIAMALADADVDPRSISYVETHGTATPVGDPIEIEGLTRAFRSATDDTGYCLIGSVKSNIGHLVAAAGAAGAVKTALALSARRLPPTVHFATPNPTIDFANTPFRVVDRLSAWDSPPGVPRRAGVSSFGVGGTNAHVVLEEAPRHEPSEPGLAPHLLALSARDPDALAAATLRLADHLERHPDASLADVAWTLARGRKAFPHRLAVAAADSEAAVARLRSPAVAEMAAGSRPAREADVVFMFPGQGAVQAGMGRGLYAREPAFRAAFDECMEHLRSLLPDLGARIFGDGIEALRPTGIMQPATFTIEYALARTWLALGLRPVAMVGHSVGEFVAATLAGVFELPDALRLVARRGALMQAQPGGGMLAVRLGLEALLERLPPGLSLAAENAPGACVVAGPHEAVAAFQARLDADGVACRLLCTSHAFHSTMMEPVVEPFRADVEATPRGAPSIPLVSTATGQWLDAATAGSADYWSAHLRAPVRFARAVAQLAGDAPRVLLEVGPRAGLCQFVRQHPEVQRRPQLATVMSLADAADAGAEAGSLLEAAGRLWSLGADIDLAGFDHRGRRRRVCLPTYPFRRRRYWVDPPSTDDVVHQAAITTPREPEPLPVPRSVQDGAVSADLQCVAAQRKLTLVEELRALFADIAGLDLSGADPDANFMELGLDSLMLTQVVRQVQKAFRVQITFRELMGSCASLGRLAAMLDAQLPADARGAHALSRSTS